jgi:hypothetical protein
MLSQFSMGSSLGAGIRRWNSIRAGTHPGSLNQRRKNPICGVIASEAKNLASLAMT